MKEYFMEEGGRHSDEPALTSLPLIYELTSETEESAITKIKAAGFTAIYSVLDQKSIKEMLFNAGLEYRELRRQESE